MGLEPQCDCDMAAPDRRPQKPWSTKLFSFQADACDLLIEASHIPLPSSPFYIRTDSGKARSSQWNTKKGLFVASWEDNESLLLDAQDGACCLIAMMLWTKYWLFNGVLWLLIHSIQKPTVPLDCEQLAHLSQFFIFLYFLFLPFLPPFPEEHKVTGVHPQDWQFKAFPFQVAEGIPRPALISTHLQPIVALSLVSHKCHLL